jgi:hypothetical protein
MRYQSKSLLKRDVQRRTKYVSHSFDLIKYLAFFITILGILAWIAGQAFNYGYWNVAGWDGGPIIAPTLQSVAFLGFIAPFYNWIWGSIFLAVLGAYGFILALRSKRRKQDPHRFVLWARRWIEKNIEIDEEVGKLSGIVILIAIFLFGMLILPLAFWIIGAQHQGEELLKKQICQVRVAKTLPTSIKLADGTMVMGKILSRSDKFTILLDQESIHTITVGDSPRLLDSNNVLEIKCLK